MPAADAEDVDVEGVPLDYSVRGVTRGRGAKPKDERGRKYSGAV